MINNIWNGQNKKAERNEEGTYVRKSATATGIKKQEERHKGNNKGKAADRRNN